MHDEPAILEACSLTKVYRSSRRAGVHAAVDVSLTATRGTTVGLIGQSGSGKTTVTRMLLGIEQPTSGIVNFAGRDIAELDDAGMRRFRSSVTAVFQNPYSSLDPRMRIWRSVTEQLAIDKASKDVRRRRCEELLELVGFPSEVGDRYPHELSGGQRQRVAIARALAAQPQVVILDEPLSALDVSVQAQIVNLLLDLQASLELAYVFVGHDLAIARQLCDELLVMNRGHVVERGDAGVVLHDPQDPYTRALVKASVLDESTFDIAAPLEHCARC